MAETTSQTQIYIDFGATPSGPLTLGSPGGAIWLMHLTKFKVTDERSVEIVKAIGVSGGAGYRRKTGGGSIMMTENRHSPVQVDWRQLFLDAKKFMVMAQDENLGPRAKWFSVVVSKVDRDDDDEGNHTDEIELKFLQSIQA